VPIELMHEWEARHRVEQFRDTAAAKAVRNDNLIYQTLVLVHRDPDAEQHPSAVRGRWMNAEAPTPEARDAKLAEYAEGWPDYTILWYQGRIGSEKLRYVVYPGERVILRIDGSGVPATYRSF